MDSTADVIFSTTKSGHCSLQLQFLSLAADKDTEDSVRLLCPGYVCVNHKYNTVNMASASFPFCFLSTWSQTI